METGECKTVNITPDENYKLYYFIGAGWLIFAEYEYKNYVQHLTSNYYAVNCTTLERADEQTLGELLEQMNCEKNCVQAYGKDYTFKKTDDTVIFTEYGTKNNYSITIDELREKSEEFRRVEQIFDCKLTFSSVCVQNGEIYLAVRYKHNGFYAGYSYLKSSTVACYLYEPETAEFKYIGWLTINNRLMGVIKL